MRTRLAFVLAAAALAAGAIPALAGTPVSNVVISQVYGGGGNNGSTFTNDFIEIYNRSADPVDITGWSVQYASAAGTTWAVTTISNPTILQPGQYFLIQEAQGAGGTTPLPTPDAAGTIAMSANNGKVALVTNSTALTGACPTASVVDVVGFGTANCSEVAATPGLVAATAAIRGNHGCTDTNNNSADFIVGAPTPRNSAAELINPCTPAMPPSGIGASNPVQVCRNQNVVLTMTVTPGNPASAITSVIGDTTSIGGGPGVAFLDDGVAPDTAAADGIYTTQATIATSVGQFTQNVPVVISDALGRSANASVVVNVINCEPRGFGSGSPAGVCQGNSTLLTVTVTPGLNPPSSGIQVFADLSSVGGSGSQSLFDDGTNGDAAAGDNTFSYEVSVTDAIGVGTYSIGATIIDEQARAGLATFPLSVVACTDSGVDLVISQVYGGGGNNGSTYTHDFVELFNRGPETIELGGMSIQYASDSGGFNLKQDLSGSIEPGHYFLIQLARGAGGTTPLPTPDLIGLETGTGALAIAADDGRIVLTGNTNLIGDDCVIANTIIDLVGYGGGSTCFEGLATAPTTDATTAVIRARGGCQDNNQNVADFIEAAPTPRNSSSFAHPCGAPVLCLADFNGDTFVNPDDLADFITCFFLDVQFPGICPQADFNADTFRDPDDLADFITIFFLTVQLGC